MSCYFRNKGVKAIFEEVGLQVAPPSLRKKIVSELKKR